MCCNCHGFSFSCSIWRIWLWVPIQCTPLLFEKPSLYLQLLDLQMNGTSSIAGVFSNLFPGYYEITVHDSSECVAVVNTTVVPAIGLFSSKLNMDISLIRYRADVNFKHNIDMLRDFEWRNYCQSNGRSWWIFLFSKLVQPFQNSNIKYVLLDRQYNIPTRENVLWIVSRFLHTLRNRLP